MTATTATPRARQHRDQPPDRCAVHVTAWCLPPDVAARRARSLLRTCLQGCLASEQAVYDLETVAGELAANALRHACGPREMRMVSHDGVPVVFEIASAGGDAGYLAERLHIAAASGGSAAVLAESGRGLGIVIRLTGGQCGVRPARILGTGQAATSVWFAIPPGFFPRSTGDTG